MIHLSPAILNASTPYVDQRNKGVIIVLAFFMFSWILSHLFQGDLRLQMETILSESMVYAILIFFGVFVAASFYSEAPWVDIKTTLFKMGKWLFLPFLVLSLRPSKRRFWVMNAFLCSMILTLIIGTLKFYYRFSLGTRFFTDACVFKDHIFTNLMMSFTVFVLAHKVCQTSVFWMRMGFLLLCATAIYYVLFLSSGRSGYVMLGILWVLFFIQTQKGRHRIFGILSLMVLLILGNFSSSGFQHRILQVLHTAPVALGISDIIRTVDTHNTRTPTKNYEDHSILDRVHYVKNTLQMIKIHPFFGRGTGSFKRAYEQHLLNDSAHPTTVGTSNPHNEYLNVALQCGLFGLCALFWFFYCLYKKIQLLKKPEHYYGQGLLLMMMVGCMGNSWLMDFTSGYFFIVCLAFCLAASNPIPSK